MFNGEKLAEYMVKNDITRVALANELGVSESAVRHIIKGLRQPSFIQACEIAQMMGCALDELVIRKEA